MSFLEKRPAVFPVKVSDGVPADLPGLGRPRVHASSWLGMAGASLGRASLRLVAVASLAASVVVAPDSAAC